MVQQLVEQETNYNILKNVSGDLMILMRARMDNAEDPQIIYDGGEHALLYRSGNNTIVLDYIHPDVRDNLTRAQSVLIVEAQGSSIIREYYSKVKTIKKVPLPDNIKMAV